MSSFCTIVAHCWPFALPFAGVPFADEFDSLIAYVKSGQPAEGHDKNRVAGEPGRRRSQDAVS
jgi:hypothetical protein